MSLILWDYDGVLVDSLEVEKEFFTVACQEAGIEEIRSFEDLSKLCEGNYYEECMKAGIDLRKVEEAIEILEKKIIESGCEINFFPGMAEILTETARWFPSYIITSNNEPTVKATLKRHQIKGIRGVLGYETDSSKVRKINHVKNLFPGEKTYYIGDTSGDIFEARESGVDVAIGVTWGWHGAEVLKKARPDYIFSEIPELKDFLYSLKEEDTRKKIG